MNGIRDVTSPCLIPFGLEVNRVRRDQIGILGAVRIEEVVVIREGKKNLTPIGQMMKTAINRLAPDPKKRRGCGTGRH